MAITKSAKKAIRVSARKRVINLRRSRDMKDNIKETIKVARTGSKEEKKVQLIKAQKAIDKAAKKGIIKVGNASRKKSRLTRIIKESN